MLYTYLTTGDLVLLFQASTEEAVVGDVGVFNSEVADYEGEGDGLGGVAEEHGGVGFKETVGLKVGEETKLGEETGLGKAGNALPDVGEEEGLPRAAGLNEGERWRSERREAG